MIMRIRNVIHHGMGRLVVDDDASGLQPAVIPKLRRMISFLQDMQAEDGSRKSMSCLTARSRIRKVCPQLPVERDISCSPQEFQLPHRLQMAGERVAVLLLPGFLDQPQTETTITFFLFKRRH
jgi:hypothetical protein